MALTLLERLAEIADLFVKIDKLYHTLDTEFPEYFDSSTEHYFNEQCELSSKLVNLLLIDYNNDEFTDQLTEELSHDLSEMDRIYSKSGFVEEIFEKYQTKFTDEFVVPDWLV